MGKRVDRIKLGKSAQIGTCFVEVGCRGLVFLTTFCPVIVVLWQVSRQCDLQDDLICLHILK